MDRVSCNQFEKLKIFNVDYNEFDNLKIEKLPSDVINSLARDLPKDWIELARFLGINNKEIDNIKDEFETNIEQAFQILNSWCQNNPFKEWKDIKSKLILLKRRDVISKCERKLSVHSIFGVQPSSENLFPREEKLREIHYYLYELQDKKTSTLILYGMSGVGKTQIARKYCEVYNNFYENIIWIDATFGKLQTSVNNLCQTLGFIVQDSKGDYFNIEVIVEKIHNYYKNENTLYVFDNVDDESVRNIRIYISKKPNSFTLITSQWRMWSDNVYQMLIYVFSPEDAFTYVKNNIKTNNEDKIKELVKELGFHPFAITQAIKYMNMYEVSIETFISRYRAHPIEILDSEKLRTEEESKSAIKAVNLFLIKLEKTEIIPLKILNFLSHCNGQNISKHFVTQISKYMEINEEYVIDDAIRLLQNYSLLDRVGDDKYKMHELTQLSCRYFQIKNSSTDTYLDLIEGYFNYELNQLKDNVECGNHFVVHFLYMFRGNVKRMSKNFHLSADKIYCLLTSKDLFIDSIEILRSFQDFVVEIYGENSERTLDTNKKIAICLFKMEKYAEALEMYFSIDKIQTEIFGINHRSSMSTKNNIALCLCKMRKYNESLEILYSVDKIQTETLGNNHHSTLSTKNIIAACLEEMGKHCEALEIYYSVQKIQTEIAGTKHLSTIDKTKNIAVCLFKMGKYNEALKFFYSDVKIQTETLGLNHTSTMITKYNVALCLYKTGKYNEALEILRSVDEIQAETLGVNHKSSIKTKKIISNCLRKLRTCNSIEII